MYRNGVCKNRMVDQLCVCASAKNSKVQQTMVMYCIYIERERGSIITFNAILSVAV